MDWTGKLQEWLVAVEGLTLYKDGNQTTDTQKGQLKWREALQLEVQQSRPRRHVLSVVNVKGFGDSRSKREIKAEERTDGVETENHEIDKQMEQARLVDAAALLDACKAH